MQKFKLELFRFKDMWASVCKPCVLMCEYVNACQPSRLFLGGISNPQGFVSGGGCFLGYKILFLVGPNKLSIFDCDENTIYTLHIYRFLCARGDHTDLKNRTQKNGGTVNNQKKRKVARKFLQDLPTDVHFLLERTRKKILTFFHS